MNLIMNFCVYLYLFSVIGIRIYEVETQASFSLNPNRDVEYDFTAVRPLYMGQKSSLSSRKIILEDPFESWDSLNLLLSTTKTQELVLQHGTVTSSDTDIALPTNSLVPQGYLSKREWTIWSIAMVCKKPGTVTFQAKIPVQFKDGEFSRRFSVSWTKVCKKDSLRKGLCIETKPNECDLVNNGELMSAGRNITIKNGDSIFARLSPNEGTQYSLGLVPATGSSIGVSSDMGAPLIVGIQPIGGTIFCRHCISDERVADFCQERIWMDVGLFDNIPLDLRVICPSEQDFEALPDDEYFLDDKNEL